MSSGTFHDLDRPGALAAADTLVRARRQVAVDELLVVLQWADLHAGDPQDEPGAVPVRQGGDRLISLGGDGTPQVAELCWAELAVARRAGVIATRNVAADALDLRHRLPLLFAKVVGLELEVWLARRIATMSRALSREAVRVVDVAVSRADDLAPGRLLALAEAKVIEADLDAHRARAEHDAVRTGVWFSRPRPGDLLGGQAGAAEAATRGVAARLGLAEALELETALEEIADLLALHAGDPSRTRDQLRADALALLARPDRALALLEGARMPAADGQDARRLPARPATLYLHLSAAVLEGSPGLARCDRLGPLLLEQVRQVLARRDVRVQPVIDLNAVHAVDAYEHPTSMRRRTVLRTGGDVFPHSSGGSRRLDHDHVVPYDPLGPPGQTSDRNDAPLTRRHHRVKTHAGWQLSQIGLGAYRWISPHGLGRVVTPRGTRVVEPLRDRDGRVVGEIYPASSGPVPAIRWEEPS